MMELLTQPWPWYVAGPLLGVFAPLLLYLGNRMFGMSNNLRHMCAALLPRDNTFLLYDWRSVGGWNLAFAMGTLAGGVIAGVILADPEPVAISAQTRAELMALGIRDFHGLVPADLFSFRALLTVQGAFAVLGGGFLVGFGTAYAGGCTSGHGITGIADLQPASFVALLAFFVGGIAGTFLLLPLIL
jgi:hypothetical protein